MDINFSITNSLSNIYTLLMLRSNKVFIIDFRAKRRISYYHFYSFDWYQFKEYTHYCCSKKSSIKPDTNIYLHMFSLHCCMMRGILVNIWQKWMKGIKEGRVLHASKTTASHVGLKSQWDTKCNATKPISIYDLSFSPRFPKSSLSQIF